MAQVDIPVATTILLDCQLCNVKNWRKLRRCAAQLAQVLTLIGRDLELHIPLADRNPGPRYKMYSTVCTSVQEFCNLSAGCQETYFTSGIVVWQPVSCWHTCIFLFTVCAREGIY